MGISFSKEMVVVWVVHGPEGSAPVRGLEEAGIILSLSRGLFAPRLTFFAIRTQAQRSLGAYSFRGKGVSRMGEARSPP